jgi:hypothetical protein
LEIAYFFDVEEVEGKGEEEKEKYIFRTYDMPSPVLLIHHLTKPLNSLVSPFTDEKNGT